MTDIGCGPAGNNFQISTLCHTVLDELRSALFLDIVVKWLIIVNGFPKCCRAIVIIYFTESCQFLIHCCLRDRGSHALSVGFSSCPLYAEISADSFNLLTTLWAVDGEMVMMH